MTLSLIGQPLRRRGLRICRCCGCDDDHACFTEEGPCAWVLLDLATPTGVCSTCAEALRWDPIQLAVVGFDEMTEDVP